MLIFINIERKKETFNKKDFVTPYHHSVQEFDISLKNNYNRLPGRMHSGNLHEVFRSFQCYSDHVFLLSAIVVSQSAVSYLIWLVPQ